MTVGRLHMGLALLVALVLHGALLGWLGLPSHRPLVEPRPPLSIKMLPAVAETTHSSAPPAPPAETRPLSPPPPAPVQRPRPKPKAARKAVSRADLPPPEPVAEPAPVEPAAAVERETEIESEKEPPQPATVAEPAETASIRYEQLVAAWLEKHKRYPRRAKRLRIEGQGRLRMRIGPDGHVRQLTLVQSTGNRLLDRAVLEMVRRADPFPPAPEQFPRQELEFIVPVVFSLR